MSYQTLKLKTDGVVVNALLLPESGEELLEKTIKTISANLKQSLKIKLNDEDKELLGMESNEKIYSTRPTVNDISVAEMLQQSIDEGKIDSEMYNELIQEFPSTLQEELKSNIKNTNTTTSDTTSNNNTESSKSNSIDDFRFLSSLESSDSDK